MMDLEEEQKHKKTPQCKVVEAVYSIEPEVVEVVSSIAVPEDSISAAISKCVACEVGVSNFQAIESRYILVNNRLRQFNVIAEQCRKRLANRKC